MGQQALWQNFSHALARAIPESAIEKRVLAYIQASSAPCYAIACSGGVDSLALLLWARGSAVFKDKALTVLHYNHQLRGKLADADEAFVKDVAEALGCAYRSAQRSAKAPISEAALREDRFAFFHTTMQAEGIEALLLGHQEDDVAETLLMRLGRGSGSRGLAAPRPVQTVGSYVHLRPFLSLSKAFIVRTLRACGISWREDASNLEGFYLRNRIRQSVLPALGEAFKDREVLKGFALSRTLLEEEDEALELWLAQVLKNQDLSKGLSRACLTGLPRALWRRALHVFLRVHGIQNRLSSQGFERLLNDFYDHTLRPLAIGDKTLFLQKTGQGKQQQLSLLVCIQKEEEPPLPVLNPILLQRGMILHFPNADALKIEGFPGSYEERLASIEAREASLYEAFVAADRPLYYRFWKQGDRYRPLNAPGSKKLQDLFVDKKVPKGLRSQLPVVLDEAFRPIWAPGLPVADSHKILPATQLALKLTYTKNI